MAALAAVPLERLCPVGFVFVWADKAHLHAVVKLLYTRKFVYVENLTWVHMGPDNRALALDAPHSRASHTTLLMFRKDGAIQTFMHESLHAARTARCSCSARTVRCSLRAVNVLDAPVTPRCSCSGRTTIQPNAVRKANAA